MRIPKLVPVILLLISLSSFAQVKLEPSGALNDPAVPAAVRDVLEASGTRVVRGDGSPLCEIWLRKDLPAPAGPAAKDVLYPELSESVMVGVISFPDGAKDFRGQRIKGGYFTMRYGLLPEDGNHLGVAPNRDFLLLVPAGADPGPGAKLSFAQLVKLSAQAAGSNHPAAFAMLAPEGGTLPRVFENADSFTVFAGRLKTDAGKAVPFELIVKGEAPQ